MIDRYIEKDNYESYTVFYFIVLLIVKHLELLRFNYINITNPEILLRGWSLNLGINHSWLNLYYYKMKVKILLTKNRFSLHLILQILELKFYR